MSTSDAHVTTLPEPFRLRAVALAAAVLPQVAEPPVALRRVAAFAPARRARLGGTQIAAALDADSGFREHLAPLVAAAHPEVAPGVAAGEYPAMANPVEVGALAWLLRGERWPELLAEAVQQWESASTRDAEQADRLRSRLEAAESAAREQKARHKQRVDELKAENASLRRKVGELRATQRAVSEGADQAATEAVDARAAAETALAAAEAETRRLRAQVEELTTQLAAARRDVRSGRDVATLRARLLLDTLLDAGQGLRRELALPPVTGAPGDSAEAEIAEAGTRDPSSVGALGPSSPVLLENFLAMPRARLLIDGYNVSMLAWPESSLEAQRIRLLAALAPLAARTGAETTVVFDAAASTHRPPVNAPRGVKVLFSPEGVIADDVLRDLVAAEPTGRVVVVVSSDQEVARDVRRAGARSVGSEALLALLAR